MSAYIIDDKNYDFLLSKLNLHARTFSAMYVGEKRYEFNNVDDLAELGNILKAQNYNSVNHRYKEQTAIEPYVFNFCHKDVPKVSTGVAAMKILDCYEYQSCETDNAQDTQAFRITANMRKLFAKLIHGYDDAPWGLTS